MKVLGIVGPMGSGKSVVLEMFGELGAVTMRADDLSRELLKPGAEVTSQVRDAFGETFFDAQGNLLRGKLAELIFSSEEARRRLTAIMSPPMVALLKERLDQLRHGLCGPQLVVVEAANLHEMGAGELVDCLLRVTAPRPVRRQRICARDGLSAQEASRRLDAHAAAGLDASPADHEIDTDRPLAQVQAQVRQLYEQITEGCAGQ